MRLLLDTHLLIWSAGWIYSDQGPSPLSRVAIELIDDEDNEAIFSAASIWEVAIKWARDKPDFDLEPNDLRRRLLEQGYIELAVSSRHAVAVATLPGLHKDPFDRILIAQASVEGLTLLTADKTVAAYPGQIRLV